MLHTKEIMSSLGMLHEHFDWIMLFAERQT